MPHPVNAVSVTVHAITCVYGEALQQGMWPINSYSPWAPRSLWLALTHTDTHTEAHTHTCCAENVQTIV